MKKIMHQDVRTLPTLTEVVDALVTPPVLEEVVAEVDGAALTLCNAAPESLAPAQSSLSAGEPSKLSAPQGVDLLLRPAPPVDWSDALAEQMAHRVIQRVDGLLTQRIGEVVAAVVEAQTRSLLPSIRQELEFAIRQSVYEAVAEELSDTDAAATALPS